MQNFETVKAPNSDVTEVNKVIDTIGDAHRADFADQGLKVDAAEIRRKRALLRMHSGSKVVMNGKSVLKVEGEIYLEDGSAYIQTAQSRGWNGKYASKLKSWGGSKGEVVVPERFAGAQEEPSASPSPTSAGTPSPTTVQASA